MAHDTIVIGAGVMGSAIALRLAAAGQRVLVLEKSVPGAEASSAAAGILGPQVEAEQDGPLFRLTLASRDRYPDFIADVEERSGHATGYRRSGVVRAALDEHELRQLALERDWQRRAGLSFEVLSADECRRAEPALGPRVAGGLHFRDEAQVDAQALAQALPVAARRAGACFERAAVASVAIENGRAVGVRTDSGTIPAAAVVLAAGAWTSLVAGSLLPPDAIAPVRGQMVLLAGAIAGSPHAVIFGPHGYLVPRDAGRVLLGSTMERVGFDKRVTAAGVASILAAALELAPDLADATLESSWAGFRPAPRDGLPLLGSLLPGLFVASGHHRNGILLTPVSAELVAGAVLGRTPALDVTPFRPDRFAS